jgi:hypothetical protein
MLKDRRVLLEQEMIKQKQACGQLYLRIVKGECDANDSKIYDSMKMKLADMMTELMIVNQMLVDGHQ